MKASITRTKNAAAMIINSSCGFYDERHFPGLITAITKLYSDSTANTSREIVSSLERNYGVIPDGVCGNLLHIYPYTLGKKEMIVDCYFPGIIYTKGT